MQSIQDELIAPSIYTDGTYLEKTGSWHEEDSAWKAQNVKRMLERNGLRPRTVCEVGCGAGEILNWLSRELPATEAFTGYDISPQAIALCRQRASDRLAFRLGDVLEEDASFDLVMAIDVFEHVEDYLGFLKKLKAKAAYTLFHIPLDLSVQSVLRGTPILKTRREVGHLHYFTKETALKSLEDSGYEIVDHFYTGSAIELPARGWKATLMKLPRRAAYAISPDWTVRVLGGYSLMVLAR